jgi:hypothetical protein
VTSWYVPGTHISQYSEEKKLLRHMGIIEKKIIKPLFSKMVAAGGILVSKVKKYQVNA